MHHAWKCSAAILLGVLLCSPGGVTAAETTATSTSAVVRGTWLKNAVASLSAMPDADALATAGVLAQQLPNAQTLDLLDRAVAASPQATGIGLLDVTVCSGHAGCDALQREAHLRAVDPHNGNLWLVALRDASIHHDQPRVDTVLAKMAQSSNFDLHFMSLGQRFLVAMKRIPPPPGAPGASADSLRHEQAMALVTAFALPSMQPLVDTCKPGHPVNDARRKTCRAIAGSLRHSDSLISKMIGLRLQEWNARDAADRNDALAGRRRLQWKMSQLGAVNMNSAMPPATQVGIMLAHENEVDGIDAVLRVTGRPLDPPVDWQAPHSAPASIARSLP